MTDRDACQLRGPVHTVRFQYASINLETGDWEPAREGPTLTFDRDGWLDGRARGDSATTTLVHEDGTRTTVGPRPPAIRRQPGLEYGIGTDGTMPFDVVTQYDSHGHPTELTFRDAGQQPLHRIVLSYDADGRIAGEQVFMGEFGTRMSNTPENVPPPSAEELAELVATFEAMMPDHLFLAREYAYDAHGRVAQLVEVMGALSERRRTFTYDDRNNVVEEHHESRDREADLGADGRLEILNETFRETWSRYEYQYDDRGNWSERIAFGRVAPDQHFHRSSVERRTISYY